MKVEGSGSWKYWKDKEEGRRRGGPQRKGWLETVLALSVGKTNNL